MQISKKYIQNLYIEAENRVIELEYELLNTQNFSSVIIKWQLLEYWRGKRDAYYVLLKGVRNV